MATDAVHSPQRARKPPLADWPTIKILTPPKGSTLRHCSIATKFTLLTSGRFSLKTDEWCLTYCSQTITGRIHSKEPFCRSICIRKVFPHEVKNIVAFKNHRNVAADGKTKYPLPVEGQPANVPRYLGGMPTEDDDVREPTVDGIKVWDEGWYFWTSDSRLAIHEKTDTMLMDLEQQRRLAEHREQRREVWQDYQDHLQNALQNQEGEDSHNGQPSRWWGPIVPPRPVPAFRYVTTRRLLHVYLMLVSSSHSLLVPLPPDIPPFWGRISKLLAPSYKVLSIFHESLISGEQKKFANRVWEKTWSNEPFILASRTFSATYERWKDRDIQADEDDGKKGPGTS